MKQSINTNKLPLPRLEFLWSSSGPEKRVCEYCLVLPVSEFDIRSNSEDEIGHYDEWRCMIGETTCDGGRSVINGEVQTPFRDHTHMLNDFQALGSNLPMYAVCGDVVTKIECKR